MTKNMHFKILKIHFKNEISGKKSGTIFETGYPAGSRFSRISGRFLVLTMKNNLVTQSAAIKEIIHNKFVYRFG